MLNNSQQVLFLMPLPVPSYVRLVAVTKGRPVSDIEFLIQKGQLWFGENRLQEIQEKWPILREKYPHVKLQFIGQLQSNKAALALFLCDSIIGIDRPSLVNALATALLKNPKNVEFLVQVNLAKESQKGGVAPGDLDDFLEFCSKRGISVAGLMTLPPVDADPRPYFKNLKELCLSYSFVECSMGMSDDYAIAIEKGATQVRIGRKLFENFHP